MKFEASADEPYETDPLQHNPSTGSGGWGRPNHMGWQQKHSSKHSDKNGLDCSRFVTWFTRVMGTDKDHLVFLRPCVVSDPVHGISRVFILNRDWTHPNEMTTLPRSSQVLSVRQTMQFCLQLRHMFLQRFIPRVNTQSHILHIRCQPIQF